MRTEQKWNNKIRQKFLLNLSPRLRRDLSKYKEPVPPIPAGDIPSTYYWGEVGTGKTVRAAQLMLEQAKRIYLDTNYVISYNDCVFISVPELFSQLKSSFNDDVKFQAYMNKYQKCYFLVLDDIGAEKASEWALQQLYLIINYRYEYMLTTVITSNKTLEDLAAFFGDDRIPSRIQRMGEIWEKVKRW